MGTVKPDLEVQRQVLAEARAQYDVRPSPYVHGVMAALAWALDETRRSPVSATHSARPAGEEEVAAEEGHAREGVRRATEVPVRDYCLGVGVTLGWVRGAIGERPLPTVMTYPGSGQPRSGG